MVVSLLHAAKLCFSERHAYLRAILGGEHVARGLRNIVLKRRHGELKMPSYDLRI